MFLSRNRSLRNLLETLVRPLSKNDAPRKPGGKKFFCVDTIPLAQPKNFDAGYTAEEKDLLLRTINHCTTEELKRFSITAAGIKRVMAYRDDKSFENLEELLLLQGIEVAVIHKFCKSVLKKELPQSSRRPGSRCDVVTPPLPKELQSEIHTCAGIWICGETISWAKLDTDYNLSQWNCETMREVATKDGLVAVVDSVSSVVSRIPISHAYVLESDAIVPFARMRSGAYYQYLRRQQIISAVATLLGTREKRCGENSENANSLINNVYMMRSRFPARLYGLLVGAEVVSAREFAWKLLEARLGASESFSPIEADPSTKEEYRSRDIYQREQMCWALLLAHAFVHSAIEQSDSVKVRTVK